MIYQLRNLYLSGINSVKRADTLNVVEFLSRGAYTIDSPPSARGGKLVSNVSDYTGVIANEINRFASASLESVFTSKVCIDSSIYSWPLISLYYSAFFAAHSIMRIFGRTLTYIDAYSRDVINNASHNYLGIRGGVQSGIHKIIFGNDGTIEIYNAATKDSHQQLWKDFCDLVDHLLSHLISNLPPSRDRDKLIDILTDISTNIKTNRTNLTAFRNKINYRQAENVWMPSKPAKRIRRTSYPAVISWKNIDIYAFHGKEDIEKFTFLCLKVIKLNSLIISDLESIKTDGKIFLDNSVSKIDKLLFGK